MLTREQSKLLATTIHAVARGGTVSLFDLGKLKSAFKEAKSEPWFRDRVLEIVGTLDPSIAAAMRADIAAGKI